MTYLFQVDSQGGIIAGQALPDWIVGDESIWSAQERAFYDAVSGRWTIYDPIVVEAPASISVGTVFTTTVTLPTNSPDTEVTIKVDGQEFILPVTNSQAKKDVKFNDAGEHSIEALSRHHGGTYVKVVAI